MPWVKLDDGYLTHRKFLRLGGLRPLASQLWVNGLVLSGGALLDGRVPRSALPTLLQLDGWAYQGAPVTIAALEAALVRVGLWTVDLEADEVVYHGYAEYQPTAEEWAHQQAETAKRKAAYRQRHQGNAIRNAVPHTVPHAVPHAVQNSVRTDVPDPDPDPERTTSSLTTPPTPHGGLVGGARQARMAAMEVVELWNQRMRGTPIPQATNVDDEYLRRIAQVLKTMTLDHFDAMFRRVAASAWCRGDNDRGFVVDLWWILKNRLEVLSGRYDDREARPITPAPSDTPNAARAAGAVALLRRKA